MNRSRKIAVVVSVLALAGLAAHAQVEPVSGTAPASTSGPTKAADGSETWPSGLVFRSLREGSGASPSPTDTVKVHYRGTFPDGRAFDSSYKRGQPTSFPLNRVIPCWTEAVQLMRPGGKARITCPPATAYGERGAGGVIPPNATLVFEVELLGVQA